MLHDIIRTALSVQCSKSAKLCLVTLAAYLHKPQWTVNDFCNLLGCEAKTIRQALKELTTIKLVKQIGISETSAHIYQLEFDLLMALEQPDLERSAPSDLASLQRRVQRHRSADKKKPEPSKAS